MKEDQFEWEWPDPFVMPIRAGQDCVDRLGHVNNVEYVRWFEEISWAHIESLGLVWELQQKTGRAMAIVRTEIDYLAAASADDPMLLGTWLLAFDGRLRSQRRFQLIRCRDGRTLARAMSRHVCIDIRTQRPARVPETFRRLLAPAVVATGDQR